MFQYVSKLPTHSDVQMEPFSFEVNGNIFLKEIRDNPSFSCSLYTDAE